jgi:hypothetical protein
MHKSALAAIAFVALLAAIAFKDHASAIPATQMFGSNQSFVYDASTSGATLIATAPAGGQVFVTGYAFLGGGTVNVDLIYGTQTTNPCDTGPVKITPAYQLVAQAGIVDHPDFWTGLKVVPAGDQLCLNTSGAVAVQAIIYYGTSP